MDGALAEVGGGDVEVGADLLRRPLRERRPWSSTWIRSQTSMISAMLWSISSTPAPCSSRTERTAAAKSGTSASGRPAAGSSSSTKRGSVASARATPSRRSSPWASDAAGWSAYAARPSRPSSSSARRVASRGEAPTPSADDLDVLAHREAAEGVAVLERAGEPVAAAPVRRPAGHVPARRARHVAVARPVEAAEHVDERRLAGAVRADQPDDLARPQLERDVAERLDALERPGHGGGPERFSGPPLVSRRAVKPLRNRRDDLGLDRAKLASACCC